MRQQARWLFVRVAAMTPLVIGLACSGAGNAPTGKGEWLPARPDGLLAIRAALATVNLDSLCVDSCSTVVLDPIVHLAPALVPLGLPALPAAYRLSIDEVARSFPRKQLLPPATQPHSAQRDTVFVSLALAPVHRGDRGEVGVILEIDPPESFGMMVFLVMHCEHGRWTVVRRFSDQA